MIKKWYQDECKNSSLLRLASLPIGVIGVISIMAGLVGMFLDKGAAGVAVTVGGTILTALPIAKAWQKQAEK